MIEGSGSVSLANGSGRAKNLRTLRNWIWNTVKKLFGTILQSGLSNSEWTELTGLRRRIIGGSLQSGLCPNAQDSRAANRLNLLGSGGGLLTAASSPASSLMHKTEELHID
jgi:hypothetical protein